MKIKTTLDSLTISLKTTNVWCEEHLQLCNYTVPCISCTGCLGRVGGWFRRMYSHMKSRTLRGKSSETRMNFTHYQQLLQCLERGFLTFNVSLVVQKFMHHLICENISINTRLLGILFLFNITIFNSNNKYQMVYIHLFWLFCLDSTCILSLLFRCLFQFVRFCSLHVLAVCKDLWFNLGCMNFL